jgi:hypothetical protein
MKTLLVAAVIFCFCGVELSAEHIPRTHKFQLWGTLDHEMDKLNFFIGFTNGLVASGVTVLECNGNQPARRPLYECVLFSKELDLDQAIAMIDKYYKENPGKWGDPIGSAIIDALTVNGGPCAGTAPKK